MADFDDKEQKIKITYSTNADKTADEIDDLSKSIQEQKDITIEFEKELLQLEKELSSTSKANLSRQKLLKYQIGQLKGALKDQRVSLKDLNNEKKKAIKSNENYATGIKKTSTLVQTLDRYTGGLASEFVNMGKAASKSGKAMKAALITSGIGIAVVLLGTIVEYWDDIVDFVKGTNKELQKQIDLKSDLIDDLQDELDLLELQKTVLENQEVSVENINELIEKTLKEQLNFLEAKLVDLKLQDEINTAKETEVGFWEKISNLSRGVVTTVGEITEEEKKARKEREKGIQSVLKGIEDIKIKQSSAEKEKRDDIQKTIDKQIEVNTKFSENREKELQAEKDYNIETQKLLDEEEQAEIDAEDRRIERLGKRLKIEEEGIAKRKLIQDAFDAEEEDTELGFLEKLKENIDSEQTLLEEDYLAKRDLFKEDSDERILLEEEYLDEKQRLGNEEINIAQHIANEKERIDRQLEKDKQAVRMAAVDNIASIGKNLQILAGKNKKLAAAGIIIENAVGLGKIAINTAQGVMQNMATFPGPVGIAFSAVTIAAGALSAAASIAATAKALKNIGAGGSAGSASSVGLPSAGGSASPLVGFQTSSENQISTSIADNINEQAPVQAFVVSTEVTTAQALDRNAVESNSF